MAIGAKFFDHCPAKQILFALVSAMIITLPYLSQAASVMETSNSVKSQNGATHQKRSSNVVGSCSLYQGGCEYKVAVVSKDCMQQDKAARTSDNEILQEEWTEEEDIPLRKLDDLENRLTKMMEDLSVRSLRHIRLIRAELRQVSNNLNQWKQSSEGGKIPQETDKPACPPGFTTVAGWSSCYRFSSTNATWPEARERCTSLAANLVSIDTAKEVYMLDYVMRTVVANHKMVGDWWTSGAYIMHQRQWMWTSRHHVRAIEQPRWATGAPRDREPSSTRCLKLHKTDRHEWFDAVCTERHHYICEVEIE